MSLTGALVTFPRCVDTHAAAKQTAVAGLQGVVDRVLDNYWRRWLWLCFMPSVYLFADRRYGLVLIDELPCL